MFTNNLKSLLTNNKPIINGWLSLPNSFTAEGMSSLGWDSITIDLQHGHNDYSSSIAMVQKKNNHYDHAANQL